MLASFTFTGTQTHIVGRGDVAVIDPGPDIPSHIDALLKATAGERIVVGESMDRVVELAVDYQQRKAMLPSLMRSSSNTLVTE